MKNISITLGAINQSKNALAKLLNADLPIKLAYSLSKLEREISTHLQDFQKAINPIIIKHGRKMPNGNYELTPDMPNYQILFEKHVELSSEKVMFNVPEINIDSLLNDNNLKLSSNDLVLLDWLLNPENYTTNKEKPLKKV